MATMRLDYDLIGSVPEMEKYRDSTKFVSMVSEFERTGDADLGEILLHCARHFYGIPSSEIETHGQLLDALRTVDEELRV